MNDDADILELVGQIRELSADIDRLREKIRTANALSFTLQTAQRDFEDQRENLYREIRRRSETAVTG